MRKVLGKYIHITQSGVDGDVDVRFIHLTVSSFGLCSARKMLIYLRKFSGGHLTAHGM